jgi:DNA topoisomerase I
MVPSDENSPSSAQKNSSGHRHRRSGRSSRSGRSKQRCAVVAANATSIDVLSRSRQRYEPGTSPPRERQTALVVNLLDRTAIRVGNDEYRRTNGSYALSTFRSRHARVHAGDVVFNFDGKSGQRHRVELHDRRLARLVAQCQDLPGQTLFSYLDADDKPHAVTSEKVNEYIRFATSGDFTARHHRLAAGAESRPSQPVNRCNRRSNFAPESECSGRVHRTGRRRVRIRSGTEMDAIR